MFFTTLTLEAESTAILFLILEARVSAANLAPESNAASGFRLTSIVLGSGLDGTLRLDTGFVGALISLEGATVDVLLEICTDGLEAVGLELEELVSPECIPPGSGDLGTLMPDTGALTLEELPILERSSLGAGIGASTEVAGFNEDFQVEEDSPFFCVVKVFPPNENVSLPDLRAVEKADPKVSSVV